VTEDLKSKIEENAAGPKQVSGDEATVQAHDPSQQIEAARFLSGNEAVKAKNRGLRFSKISPPGAV
jgi:hypothetical protein